MGSVTDFLSGGARKGYERAGKVYREAMQGPREAYGQAAGALAPWQTTGQNALSQFMSGIGQMSDPQAFYNKWMSGYSESPEAKYQQGEMEKAVQRAAAAAGNLGAGATGKTIADYTQQISSRDRQNYLSNLMQMWRDYLSGLGGVQQQGYGAARDLGQFGFQRESLEQPYYQGEAESEFGRSLNPWGAIAGKALGAFGGGSDWFMPGFNRGIGG